MLWRNSKINNYSEKKNRFSIRKLSIGAASVMIGAFFFGISSSQTVSADTVSAESTTEVISPNKTQPTETKADNSVGSNKTTEDSSTSTDKEAIVKDAQKQLDNNDIIDKDDVKQVNQTIHYQEQGTGNKLANDNKQDVTFVPYYKKASATVKYVDDSSQKTLDTDIVKGYVGNKTPYNGKDQIKNYEDQGYELKSNNIPEQGIKFDNDQDQSYLAHFIHGIEDVSDSSEVTRTIHYEGAGELTPKDVKQSAKFKATGTRDKVTGKEDISWDAEKQLVAVSSPEIKGYHIVSISADSTDGKNVDAVTVKHDDQDYTVTVIYAKNATEVRGDNNVLSTQTVKFVDEDGNTLKAPDIQYHTFKYSGDTYDTFTNKKIKDGSWDAESHTYNVVTVPVIDGYVATSGYTTNSDGQIVAGGLTATQSDPDVVATVVYKKIGNIVPQDPSGNPIPDPSNPSTNVPDKPYVNDPDDPTKVTPNESVPTIPGCTPNTQNVTPEDPTKDTPVVYTPDTVAKGDVTVTVHDNTTNQNLPQYGYTTGEQNVGYKVNYDKDQVINNLTNAGYRVLNPDATIPSEVTEGSQTVTIYVEHTTTTVTPDKPGNPGDPVDPSNATGPRYPSGTDLNSLKKTITQTVHYIGAGDKTPADKTQSFTFTKEITFDNVTGEVTKDTGWNENSHDFTSETTPVINGYHADKAQAGGETVTPTDEDITVNVIYTPNGHIVPVDPDGNPIPGTETPTFPTDPNDPTKVDTGNVPSVPDGWTPVDHKPGDNISPDPDDPGKDVEVPFTPVIATPDQGSISVVVHDNTTNQDLPDYGKTSGKADVGTKFDFNKDTIIKDLEDKGYKVDNPDVVIPGEVTKGKQTVTIYVEHDTETITPSNPGTPGEPINPNDPDGPKWPDGTDKDSLQKLGKQTIYYVGAGKDTPKDDVQTTTFKHEVVIDKVTGEIVKDNGWTPDSYTFDTVDTPVVDGYHADKKIAGGNTVTLDNLNATDTVTYTPNGKIVPVDESGTPIPNVDEPEYSTDPKDPTKVVPDEAVPTIDGYTPYQDTVTPQDPGEDTEIVYTKPVAEKGVVNVYVHDNTTGQNLSEYSYTTGEQDVGYKVTYDKSAIINDLTNKGYVVLNPEVAIPSEVIEGSQNIIIYVGHGSVPVSPDTPAPSYPNVVTPQALYVSLVAIPRFIQDNDSYDYTDESTATKYYIVYKGNNEVAKDLTADEARSSFDDIQSPNIDGYYLVDTDQQKVSGSDVSLDSKGNEITVYYAKLVNGSVTYHDDTTNKDLDTDTLSSGKPGDKIEYTTQDKISDYLNKGYKLVSNNFTDGSSTYAKNAENNKFIVHLTHDTVPVNSKTPGKSGEPINPSDPDSHKYPADTDSKNLTKTVTRTINYLDESNQKIAVSHTDSVIFTGSGVIDKVTGNLVNLNADGSIKDQNGKLTWTVTDGSPDFAKVTSPTIKGMHVESITPSENADGNDVKSQSVTRDDSNITVDVYYAEDDTEIKDSKDITSKQIVKFVDKDGNELHDSNEQTSTFTYSGDTYDQVTGKKTKDGFWNENQHTYDTVDVPKIDGYVAISGFTKDSTGKYIAGGLTATPDNPDVGVKVVYAKVGKIVPEDSSHNPIPNAPTPSYKNDQSDPTKVVPDESVPEINGYTPETPTVTPQDPTKDTKVVYTKLVNGSISYIDDTTGTTLATDSLGEGKVGSEINYSTQNRISSYEGQGYKLISDNFANSSKTYNEDITKNNFEVHLAHVTMPIDPEHPGKPGEPINPSDSNSAKYPLGTDSTNLTKTVTRTINYVDENGNKLTDSHIQNVTFTAKGVLDKVTGKLVNLNDDGSIKDQNGKLVWTEEQKFASVKSPEVDGYYIVGVDKDGSADNKNVAEATVDYTDNSYDVNVTYSRITSSSGTTTPNDGIPDDGTDKPAAPSDNTPTNLTPHEDSNKPDLPSENNKKPVNSTKTKKKKHVSSTNRSKKVKSSKKNIITNSNVHAQDEQKFGLYEASKLKSENITSKYDEVSTVKGSAVNTTNIASHSESELPKTGEKDSESSLAVLGLELAQIAALIGLVADRKRKNK